MRNHGHFKERTRPFRSRRRFFQTRENDFKKRTGPFRSRSGVLLGVCKGLSEYLNFPVFWSRAIAIALLLFTGLWPVVGLYLLAALIMKPEPVLPFRDVEDHEFYSSYTTSRTLALQRLKRTYDNLNRRLRRMEDIITSKDYDWNRRFNQS